MLPKHPVLVMWMDAEQIPGPWIDPKDINDKDLMCYSVGFIIKEFKSHIVVAASKFRDGLLVGDAFRVPKGMIRAIVPLKLCSLKEKAPCR